MAQSAAPYVAALPSTLRLPRGTPKRGLENGDGTVTLRRPSCFSMTNATADVIATWHPRRLSSPPLSLYPYPIRPQSTCRDFLCRDLTSRRSPKATGDFLQGDHQRTPCKATRMNPFNLVPERFWVVVGGQEAGLVAFVQFETIQGERLFCELRSMVVKSEYRNQGIGQAMLRVILNNLEVQRPIHTVTAGDKKLVEGDDVPAQLRMERLGAVIGGKILGLGGGHCLRLDGKVTS
ncbi:hypothetical protein CBR_g37442 [Chara braunii]|uniref:N-acetyltransferase domain-containing protein n=1 Tax=Chara braunii TaxID=69332 RepID=A0A388LMZ5_CHABU|nr:hypothetical protein CBR_g37442 [Chara braunii]|eukprot:GBG83639.1 hypothetical protein CBR_g37442 [Chara braunii]